MKLSKFRSQLTNSGIRNHKSKEITNAPIFLQAMCMNIAIKPFFAPFHHAARMSMLSDLAGDKIGFCFPNGGFITSTQHLVVVTYSSNYGNRRTCKLCIWLVLSCIYYNGLSNQSLKNCAKRLTSYNLPITSLIVLPSMKNAFLRCPTTKSFANRKVYDKVPKIFPSPPLIPKEYYGNNRKSLWNTVSKRFDWTVHCAICN